MGFAIEVLEDFRKAECDEAYYAQKLLEAQERRAKLLPQMRTLFGVAKGTSIVYDGRLYTPTYREGVLVDLESEPVVGCYDLERLLDQASAQAQEDGATRDQAILGAEFEARDDAGKWPALPELCVDEIEVEIDSPGLEANGDA